jgi:hypothetical protein
VAASQRPKSTSTNKQGAGDGDGVGAAVERYLRDLGRAALAARTRDAYGQHVGAYGAWLAGRPEPGAAIAEPRGRDHAARDFKRHLKVERGWKPSSVNLALAAVDHFGLVGGLRALLGFARHGAPLDRGMDAEPEETYAHAARPGTGLVRSIGGLL